MGAVTGWVPPSTKRVARNTAEEVETRLRREMEQRLERYRHAGPAAIQPRLQELDREWDVERVLEAEAGGTILLGLALGATVSRRFYALPVFAGCMGLLHALHGAYPLLPLFRRLGCGPPRRSTGSGRR